jgi:hypothetical protein
MVGIILPKNLVPREKRRPLMNLYSIRMIAGNQCGFDQKAQVRHDGLRFYIPQLRAPDHFRDVDTKATRLSRRGRLRHIYNLDLERTNTLLESER